jgi:hypothetical protein
MPSFSMTRRDAKLPGTVNERAGTTIGQKNAQRLLMGMNTHLCRQTLEESFGKHLSKGPPG